MAEQQFRQSLDNLAGNALQQLSGILVFLAVPRILGVEEYGQTVFALTLWSFQVFSDLGFSHVYNRRLPALHAAGDRAEIAAWDATLLKWRLTGAATFGAMAGIVYTFKYATAGLGVLVAIVPVLSTAFSTLVSQATVASDFAGTRMLNSLQAIFRLLVIPAAALWSLPGWFAGQVAVALVVLSGSRARGGLLRPYREGGAYRKDLIRDNLSSALVLVVIVGLWTQLLSVSRLIASFRYPDAVIATYGLLNAGFQIVMLSFVALYAPISVRTNALFVTSANDAVAYVIARNRVVLPAFLAIAVLAAALGPWMLRQLFPAYGIEYRIALPCLLSLLHVPGIIMYGSMLMATGRTKGYLAVIVITFVVSLAVAWLAEHRFGIASAALAQLLGLGTLVVMQYFALNIGMAMPIRSHWRLAMPALFSIALVLGWLVYLVSGLFD